MKNKNNSANTFFVVLGVVNLSIICAVLITYWFYFGHSISVNHTVWGEFGTFISGTIGSLLYFSSILILAYTLKKQIDLKRDEEYQNNKRFLLNLIYQNAGFRKEVIFGVKSLGVSISTSLKDIIDELEGLNENEFQEDEDLKRFVTEIDARVKLTPFISVITSLVSVIKTVFNSDLNADDKKLLYEIIVGSVSNDERTIVVLIYAFEITDLLYKENHQYLRLDDLNFFKHYNAYSTDEGELGGELIPNIIVKPFSDKFFPLISESELKSIEQGSGFN